MKPRQEIICCQCNEQFSIRLPTEIPANLIAHCPYCDAECVIDFSKTDEIKALYRNGDTAVTLTGQYRLPDIIQAQKTDGKSG